MNLFVAAFLFAVQMPPELPLQDKRMHSQPLQQCDLAGKRLCVTNADLGQMNADSDTGPKYWLSVKGKRLDVEERDGRPSIDILPSGFWRMTYRSYGKEMGILLEQSDSERMHAGAKTRKNAVWDFYLIGRSPSLHITVETNSREDTWKFARNAAREIYACHDDEFGRQCGQLQVMRQLMYGHLEHYRGEPLRSDAGIKAAFDHIVGICTERMGYECIKVLSR